MALTLVSNSFKEGETLRMDHILSADYGFGCGGGNKSPHLAWSGVPQGTKSLAVTCFDPDAPTGSGFWHWVVVNIPAGTTELKLDAGNPKAGLLPKGASADPHRFRRSRAMADPVRRRATVLTATSSPCLPSARRRCRSMPTPRPRSSASSFTSIPSPRLL